MPSKIEGLKDLMLGEIRHLYDVEKQLVRALPRMAKAASDEELANAFREHLQVTKEQLARLERVFESLDERPKSKPCKGMKGIIEEGSEMIEELDDALLDTAIAGGGRKVEHYEMMGYESVASMAKQLGLREVADMLQETLREEMDADKLLAQLSRRLLKTAWLAGGGARQATSSAPSASARKSSAKSGSKSGSKSGGGGNSRTLTDPQEIRAWAEERGARPACVRGTGGKGDAGMIRLEFGGPKSNDANLQEISWDDWSKEFDSRGLALIVQEKTARGQKSNFNKLISRQTAQQSKKGSGR